MRSAPLAGLLACAALPVSAAVARLAPPAPARAPAAVAPALLAAPAPAALSLSPLLAPSLAPLTPVLAAPAAPQGVPPVSPRPSGTLSGDIRYIRGFPSRILGDRRDAAVYLPPGYESSGRRYPVIYLQDGQNAFDAGTAYGGVEWRLDETLERLIKAGLMEPVIVVAVYNSPARLSEYTPVADAELGGGRGDDYGRFLAEELKPFVDSRLRTLAGAGDTAIMGSSLGGLISLHLALTRPEIFGRAAAVSPSLWWAGDEILTRLESGAHEGVHPRLWADMGGREGRDEAAHRGNLERLRRLGAVLARRGDAEASVREYPDAGHDERSWAARAEDILRFLFPPRAGA